MRKQISVGSVAFIFLNALVRVAAAADQAFTIDHIELYPSDQGGRVYLNGTAAAADDAFTIELTFLMKQWNAVAPDPAALKILDQVNLGPIFWTMVVKPDAGMDPTLRTVTITGSTNATAKGPVSLNYQMPSGGWSLQYDINLPNPVNDSAGKVLNATPKLAVQNGSGLKWLKTKTRLDLIAKVGDPKLLAIDSLKDYKLAQDMDNNGLANIPLPVVEISATYALNMPAPAAAYIAGATDLNPIITITLADDFPKAGITAALNYREGMAFITPTGVPAKGKAFILGPSAATIHLKRTDIKQAVGLDYGTVLYRIDSKLEFSSLLKVPVTLNGLCEKPCCNGLPTQTLGAASADATTKAITPSTVTVEFKETVPLQKSILIDPSYSPTSLQDTLKDVLGFVKEVAKPQVPQSETPCLQSDLNLLQDELTFLSATVGTLYTLEQVLWAAQTASTERLKLSPGEPGIANRAEFDRVALQDVTNIRKQLVDRYNKRVEAFRYPALPCCDLVVPRPQPQPQ